MRHFFKLFLTSAIILCCSGMVTNCYCIQNNITYDEHGMAVPDEDNNGRIIENTNFFFDKNYLRYQYQRIKKYLLQTSKDKLDQCTTSMVEDCLNVFLNVGDVFSTLLGTLVKSFPSDPTKVRSIGSIEAMYTTRDFRFRLVSEMFSNNMTGYFNAHEDFDVPENIEITNINFEQFINYLNNKVHFIGVQCMYNIIDTMANQSILHKENKVKEEIVLCHEKISKIVDIFYYRFNIKDLSIICNGKPVTDDWAISTVKDRLVKKIVLERTLIHACKILQRINDNYNLGYDSNMLQIIRNNYIHDELGTNELIKSELEESWKNYIFK